MRPWAQEKRVALVKLLVSRYSFLVSQTEMRGGLLHVRRTGSLSKVLVDKGADIPDKIFVHAVYSKKRPEGCCAIIRFRGSNHRDGVNSLLHNAYYMMSCSQIENQFVSVKGMAVQ